WAATTGVPAAGSFGPADEFQDCKAARRRRGYGFATHRAEPLSMRIGLPQSVSHGQFGNGDRRRGRAEQRRDAEFLFLLNENAEVVGDDLRVDFVDHRGVRLAPHFAAELPLNHAERALDVAAAVVALE